MPNRKDDYLTPEAIARDKNVARAIPPRLAKNALVQQ